MSESFSLQSFQFVQQFQCLGDRCEDTCCKGWGMQVDAPRIALYKKEAPELLDAVTTGEAEHIMRRDPATDYCVKFDKGFCAIHRDRGTKFLGDACHFYPRVTRRYGDSLTQSAALSCPEITRLILFGDAPFAPVELEVDRIPTETKDYLPPTLSPEDTRTVQRAFIEAALAEDVPVERALMRIITVGESLSLSQPQQWGEMIAFLFRMADGRFLPPETNTVDGYRLIQILEALIGAAKPTARPMLDETRQAILNALGIQVAANTYDIISSTGDFTTYDTLWRRWQPLARPRMDTLLKRWLAGQIAMSGYPFSGFGSAISDRSLVLAVRFATLRLALMAKMDASGHPPDDETVVHTIHSLSRFMDHLADSTFSMMAYAEAGWASLPRLRGLIADA